MPRKKKILPRHELIKPDASMDDLREAAQSCRGCDIWQRATQAVFGEGASGAEVMFVGEQPGNREDLEGRPFVGPAGKLLDDALAEAGIDRKHVYVTNIVKHFNSTHSRKTADSQKTQRRRNSRLSAMVGGGDRTSTRRSSSVWARPRRRR